MHVAQNGKTNAARKLIVNCDGESGVWCLYLQHNAHPSRGTFLCVRTTQMSHHQRNQRSTQHAAPGLRTCVRPREQIAQVRSNLRVVSKFDQILFVVGPVGTEPNPSCASQWHFVVGMVGGGSIHEGLKSRLALVSTGRLAFLRHHDGVSVVVSDENPQRVYSMQRNKARYNRCMRESSHYASSRGVDQQSKQTK